MNARALGPSRARLSLRGLSIGDAFGERHFGPRDEVNARIAARALPSPPWRYTDDTEMALSVVEVLSVKGEIEQDLLAKRFTARWVAQPARGYGGGAHSLLHALALGRDFRDVAPSLFPGGSFGNGGAMRAGPLGAFFADAETARLVSEARASAAVTHAHVEGQAGAIAVALAAAHAARGGDADALLRSVLTTMPPCETRDAISVAADLPLETSIAEAASRLGTGARVSAVDTVPFSLWCAARHYHDFEQAMWSTVEGLGDRDTTCAIVGSVVALSASRTIPPEWIRAREPLPADFEAD